MRHPEGDANNTHSYRSAILAFGKQRGEALGPLLSYPVIQRSREGVQPTPPVISVARAFPRVGGRFWC